MMRQVTVTRGAPRAPPTVAIQRFLYPVLKAYGLGALSYLTPRLLSVILKNYRRRQRRQRQQKDGKEGGPEKGGLLADIVKLLRASLEPHRFPAFCGFTVFFGASLQPIFEHILAPHRRHQRILASFLSSSVAAAGGLQLLNSRQHKYKEAGRTIDMTLFAASKAVDVIIGELWHRRRLRRERAGKFTPLERAIGRSIDPILFALSSTLIMYTWVYTPSHLPPTYSRQITNMANADPRLLETLRNIRNRQFIYGKDTGVAHVLGSYCADLGLPSEWGDPAKTTGIPCKVVHGGITWSCEKYALYRFWEAFSRTALPIYLTLNMIRFIRPRIPKPRELVTAMLRASRSASFLGAFVALFWYGVCLTRTRIGPLFCKQQIVLDRVMTKVACLLCGWSILLETKARQTEFMGFVLPRALASLFPRTYDPKHMWIETVIFSLSAGVIMSAAKANPRRVRGVFGKLLGKVVEGARI